MRTTLLGLLLVSPGCIESWGDYQYLSGPNGWSGDTRYDDAGADVFFDVATTSMAVHEDPAVNREAILARLDEIVAERPSTQIVVFGEVVLGLYQSGDEAETEAYQRSVAEPLPGPTSEAVGLAAREHGLYVAFGIAESDGDELYNSFALVNPDGELQAVHRKFLTVHTGVGTSLDAAYSNGEGATVTEIDGVPFGLIVCNDMHSVTLAEELVAADVRVVLSALADQADAVEAGGWSPIPPIWNAWVATANRYGEEGDATYPGAASIYDPAGTVRASMNGEGWVAATMGVYR
jgi:predicted amidohydrolase